MPNGGMPVFTSIATGWRYRKIFFYKKSTGGHTSSYLTPLGDFGASIVVRPDNESWRRQWLPPLLKVELGRGCPWLVTPLVTAGQKPEDVHESILCDPIQPNPSAHWPHLAHYKWKILVPTRLDPIQLTNLTAWCNQIVSNRALNALTRPFNFVVISLYWTQLTKRKILKQFAANLKDASSRWIRVIQCKTANT